MPPRLRRRRGGGSRRRGYFSFPRRSNRSRGRSRRRPGRLDELIQARRIASIFPIVIVGLIAYMTFLLPGINQIRCGADYDAEYRRIYDAWHDGGIAPGVNDPNAYPVVVNPNYPYPGLMSDEQDEVAVIWGVQDPARRETLLRSYGYPFAAVAAICANNLIPTRPTLLGQVFNPILPLMPLLIIVPIIALAFKQTGSPGAFPAFLIALVTREFTPDDGLVDWLILLLGVLVACIPIPTRGVLPSLAHLGALSIWPTMMVAYSTSAGNVDIDTNALMIFDIAVWIMPIGMLVFLPIAWQVRENRSRST